RMDPANALAKKGNFSSFAGQRPGKREEAYGLAAESGRKSLNESETTMFRRYGRAHRDRAQHVTQSIQSQDQEETKADAAERGEDWLDADRADEIDEQERAKQEGQRLRPGDGAPGARRPVDRGRIGR